MTAYNKKLKKGVKDGKRKKIEARKEHGSEP